MISVEFNNTKDKIAWKFMTDGDFTVNTATWIILTLSDLTRK